MTNTIYIEGQGVVNMDADESAGSLMQEEHLMLNGEQKTFVQKETRDLQKPIGK